MTVFLLDLRHACRTLARSGGAGVVAIATLALGIGATTAIFSVVYGVLLRPLPYPAPDRLMAIWEVNSRGGRSRLADPNFTDFRNRSRSFSALAKYASQVVAVAGGEEPTRTTVASVTREIFAVLAVQPERGRAFAADDARIGAAPVAVVSHRYWARSLGSPLDLADTPLRIGDRVYAVVGVMPAGFEFPANAEVWIPDELDPANTSRTSHNAYGIGRLREGVTVAQASADLSGIARDIVRTLPEQGDYLMIDAEVVPLLASLTGRTSATLFVLLGAVLLLLLIACTNVANLLLAQAAARQRELAVRCALGAGRGRLIRQFLAESLVLVAAGGGAGLLAAMLGLDTLLSRAPAGLPRLEDVSVSWPVLAAVAGLSALVAIGLGLATAAHAAARAPGSLLADAGRGQASGASRQRIGRAIVAAQTALTVVLLIGAALLGRSLLRVLSVDPGFRTEDIVAIDVVKASSDDPTAKAQLAPFYADLFNRLQAIPGVERAAAASVLPLDGGLPDGLFGKIAPGETFAGIEDLEALFAKKERLGTADYCAVTPGYFQALGIPLVRGRFFDGRDAPDAPHAALISESLARREYPGVDPLGRTIQFGNMDGDVRPLTIVGIVGDTRERGLEQPPRPTVYVNLDQRPRFSATVLLRSTGDPRTTMAAARDVLRSLAPDVPPRFRTFDEIYAASLGPRRFNLTLVGVFAGTALVLALAGLYGVMACAVTQRRTEIGIRMALGATPWLVFRLVIGQGLAAMAAGMGIGIVAAFWLTRGFESLLFGVTPADPASYAVVAAMLLIAGALACYVPARRAMRADPLEALREE
ncbi:MAG: ABC transporter permease [Acidobacteria bacterium]|nr:ABC transporter permease [Acidobacteriota bacterium]